MVTHEVPANSPKKIKIPNACVGLGIRFMTPYQMLRPNGHASYLGRLRTKLTQPNFPFMAPSEGQPAVQGAPTAT